MIIVQTRKEIKRPHCLIRIVPEEINPVFYLTTEELGPYKGEEVELKVPKLRHLTFETTIIERYLRRESSVEEALMEMYLAGVSVRRVEDISEVLWGSRVSPVTITI